MHMLAFAWYTGVLAHTYVYRVGFTVSTDARRGARGAGERPVFPDLDGARVELDRVARRHDLRLEVIPQ